MVEMGKIRIGDRVIWLGSAKSLSYGNRRVPAQVVKIKEERIQIKIQTPAGEILKYVSANSLDYNSQT
jgi:hypothetical protein